MTEGKTLEKWVKEIGLNDKFVKQLEDNDVTSLDDFMELENEEEIDELMKDLNITKLMQKKKFKKGVMSLLNMEGSSKNKKKTNKNKNIEDNKKEPEEEENDEKKEQDTRVGIIKVPTLDQIDISKKNRTIMVIGATGTGKTTLLNSMVNYLYGVKFENPFRYQLIFEKQKKGGQAISQTDKVVSYFLDAPALDYQLTLIDTPGYGDTRGAAQDEKITKNIKTFFEENVQEIDAIFFVVRAPQARLTHIQKYVFQQVLGIFGNDIAGNIFVLLTFADGEEPPAIAALKEDKVPYLKAFKINNSGFGLPKKGGKVDKFKEMYWEIGIESFADVFKTLSTVKTKSLQLTKQVLTRREELENYVENIQPTINAGFVILDDIRQKIDYINRYSHIIETSKEYKIPKKVNKAREIEVGCWVTTCTSCRYTCHKGCAMDDAHKDRCCAMSNGHCTVCPSHCHHSFHRSYSYIIEYYQVTEFETVADLKDKYFDAKNKASVTDQLILGLSKDLSKCESELNILINNVRECLNELSRIALRPNVLNQDDYIGKLITAEENEKKPGYKGRVIALKEIQKRQNILSKINYEDYNPWKQYNDVQKFLKEKQKAPKKKKGLKKKQSTGLFSFFGY